jgi:hypothetical protein
MMAMLRPGAVAPHLPCVCEVRAEELEDDSVPFLVRLWTTPR